MALQRLCNMCEPHQLRRESGGEIYRSLCAISLAPRL